MDNWLTSSLPIREQHMIPGNHEWIIINKWKFCAICLSNARFRMHTHNWKHYSEVYAIALKEWMRIHERFKQVSVIKWSKLFSQIRGLSAICLNQITEFYVIRICICLAHVERCDNIMFSMLCYCRCERYCIEYRKFIIQALTETGASTKPITLIIVNRFIYWWQKQRTFTCRICDRCVRRDGFNSRRPQQKTLITTAELYNS